MPREARIELMGIVLQAANAVLIAPRVQGNTVDQDAEYFIFIKVINVIDINLMYARRFGRAKHVATVLRPDQWMSDMELLFFIYKRDVHCKVRTLSQRLIS